MGVTTNKSGPHILDTLKASYEELRRGLARIDPRAAFRFVSALKDFLRIRSRWCRPKIFSAGLDKASAKYDTVNLEAQKKEGLPMQEDTPPGNDRPQSEDDASSATGGSK